MAMGMSEKASQPVGAEGGDVGIDAAQRAALGSRRVIDQQDQAARLDITQLDFEVA